jgi:hypothetical protein
MLFRKVFGLSLVLSFSLFAALPAHAQDDDTARRRGRKYKAPPETSHLEVQVLKGFNGKPIVNAAIIFNPVKDGKDEGNLEVKTDPDGKATIDVIPTGSTVTLQVIADGFATHAEEFVLSENKNIVIKMLRPQAQISTYQDNRGKVADRPAGVQEKAKPTTPPVIQAPQPTNHTSDPNPLTPVPPDASPRL